MYADLKQIRCTEKIKLAYIDREWLVPATFLKNLKDIQASGSVIQALKKALSKGTHSYFLMCVDYITDFQNVLLLTALLRSCKPIASHISLTSPPAPPLPRNIVFSIKYYSEQPCPHLSVTAEQWNRSQ